ncbi:hypothetical protein [Schleiferilactobacillus shenzhenensis]|uniref:Uncharacterized protein n=1 Tax=Schleiferilactobacillus shenzhenensis LY-73 TaxID=1231336 RepID=U4THN2_9LACO|nr:hypothetical protein [Schleiferilactobacillus shenzhenensis]ERL63669.1 hypothetical protein L248_2457 [Schleiferilactobacillus shenzhenensis LY-73]
MTKLMMIDDELHRVSESEKEAVAMYIAELKADVLEEPDTINAFSAEDLENIWPAATTKQRHALTALVTTHFDQVVADEKAAAKRPDADKRHAFYPHVKISWAKEFAESKILGGSIVAAGQRAYAWFTRKEK